ncbi:MAG: carboxylesterase family protein, partial [Clostridia bacterium]|nr:carboxylesterase family protein [Clostridia bacterium]
HFSTYPSGEWYLHPERIICPVMLGQTQDEFTNKPDAKTPEELAALAVECFPGAEDKFLSFFSQPATEESIAKEGLIHSIAFAIRAACQQNAKEGIDQPLYAYNFDTTIPGWDNPGTFHSVDLWFFFETLAKCWRPFTGMHYDLARQMCDYWVNFIRTGDPNGIDSQGKPLPLWPRLVEDAPAQMTFTHTSVPVAWPKTELEAFLVNKLLEKAGK